VKGVLAMSAHLQEILPDALAEADDAGSDRDDWTGSEYVDRLATAIATRIVDVEDRPASQPVDPPYGAVR
jgi:hypothetical protein